MDVLMVDKKDSSLVALLVYELAVLMVAVKVSKKVEKLVVQTVFDLVEM
jgi:hypothetical protein